MREVLQTRNRAFGPNGVPTTLRQTSGTRTDTTSRLPISLGSTNKRYEPSPHPRPVAILPPLAFPQRGSGSQQRRAPDFRYGSKADIGLASIDVRFTPKSG